MADAWRYLCLILIAIVASGCATKQYQFDYHNTTVEKNWPTPPDMPRYKFVGFITGENNFVLDENKQSYFAKSIDWIKELLVGESVPRQLFRPQGGYFDNKKKRLYVSDIGHKAIYVFDFLQNQLDVWEQADELVRFVSPIGIAVGNNMTVYVSDSALSYVVKLDDSGKPLAKFGEGLLQRPTGLAFDQQSQRLFVADSKLHQILVFDTDGKLKFKIGEKKSSVNGYFNSPTYLAIAREKLIVSDTLNARVQLFDLQGKWLQSFGKRGMYVGNLPRPKGVAVDTENNIYVVESYYDHLLVFNEQGEALLPIGGRGKQVGQFDLPTGVWLDSENNIYVADMFNSRISVFQMLNVEDKKK